VDGILIGPEDGEKVARGPRNHRILAELPELEVVELRYAPDFEGVEPHNHADHVDSFYVLDGEAEFVIEDEVFRVGLARMSLRRSASYTVSAASAKATSGC
jgi:hypothetical protein